MTEQELLQLFELLTKLSLEQTLADPVFNLDVLKVRQGVKQLWEKSK